MSTRHVFRIATCCLALAGLLASSASAGVDEWTHYGPSGGDAYSLVIDPSNPDTLYVGMDDGGVYKSTDGGDHWNASSAGLGAQTSIIGLAIDPQNPMTLIANGIFRTTDGGEHWQTIENTDVYWPVVFDPQTSGIVYARGLGASSLLRSTDNGMIWAAADSGLPEDAEVVALAVDPQTPSTLYAGLFEQGVYKSVDSGASWLAANTGFSLIEPHAIAIDPLTPTTLYVAGCCEPGVFKSVDGGAHWTSSTDGLTSSNIVSLAIDPATPTTLYAGTNDTFEATVGLVYKSTDGGVTWGFVEVGPAVSALAIDPSSPSTIYSATTPEGVQRSTDGGVSWNRINEGIANTTVSSLTVDAHAPYTLYAGVYDAGIYRSLDQARTWGPPESGNLDFQYVTALAINPEDSNVLYAGSQFIGGSVLKSVDGGVNWVDSDEGIPEAGIRSLAIDPETPTTVYVGTENFGVYKSTDGGTHWMTYENDLMNGTAGALAIDPRAPETVYAGTPMGTYKSTDGGVTWVESNNGMTPMPFLWPSVEALQLDPRNPDVLYAGTSMGVFRSADGGANWLRLDLHASIRSLAIDPRIPSIVYAGGERGAWRSTDSGATWSPFDHGLGDRWVAALAVDPNDPTFVYAGTAAGSVYVIQVLDDQPILGLHEGRFHVEVEWSDFQGEAGHGYVASVRSETPTGAALRSQDSAVARFFSPDNWEQLVKVLDGRELNDHFWVFIASATDVELVTTVTDTSCGGVKTYMNPLGQAAPAVTDTAAFSDCEDPQPPSCTAGESIFCLGEGARFQVETQWGDFLGGSGSGSEVSIPGIGLTQSNDSGLFYFFSRDNWELLVKVLDGCGINDHFWVFTAATTNVEYTMTVTDTLSGEVKSYSNPLGQAAAAVTDTGAFATCP